MYSAGQCVLYLETWTKKRGIAELIGKEFNYLMLRHVVYSFERCVMYLKPWTRERGIAALMGNEFNNSAALLRCVLCLTTCNVFEALD